MYQLDCTMICKKCGDEYKERSIEPNLDNAIENLRDRLRKRGISIVRSLCSDCKKTAELSLKDSG